MIAAATGFFDGVHLGHRKVLARLCEIAKARGEKSAVVTFWPHPRSVLQQQRTAVSLDGERARATVNLIRALGGGWTPAAAQAAIDVPGRGG